MGGLKRFQFLIQVVRHGATEATHTLVIGMWVFFITGLLAEGIWSEDYPQYFGDLRKTFGSMYMVLTLSASPLQPLLQESPFAVVLFIAFLLVELLVLKFAAATVEA